MPRGLPRGSLLTNPSESVRSFLKLVKSRSPSSVLDIASGGGSGVASIADTLGGDVRIISVERDLKCLWIIQEKLKHIGRQRNSEAIGADVRQLPFKMESVDLVTSMMVMQEILGIGSVFREIRRVLKPEGSYIALINREPWVYDMIPIEQYKSFAKAVDMYSGDGDLLGKAQEEHLAPIYVEEFTDQGREFCLVEFGREKCIGCGTCAKGGASGTLSDC
jgi:ubiquinone/menaquinone biosynthesis C-methylase UbiE